MMIDSDPCAVHGDNCWAPIGPDTPVIDRDSIHGWFGLTYSSYLVLPRVILQSMPDEWQWKFVKLLERLQEAAADIEMPSSYIVKPAREVECFDLSPIEMKAAGVTEEWVSDDEPGEGEDEDGNRVIYYDEEGNELESWQRVLVPVRDTLPPYSRGRTKLELRKV
jgi:hypothetical protein